MDIQPATPFMDNTHLRLLAKLPAGGRPTLKEILSRALRH